MGRNSRLDNIQAAILSFKLQSYDKVIERRRSIARIYNQELGQLEFLNLPPGPDDCVDNFDVYQNYEFQADRRDELVEFLNQKGIGTLIQWGGKAVHQWDGLGFNQKLPKVEKFFERCLMIPMNMFLDDEDVYYVCETIKDFYS